MRQQKPVKVRNENGTEIDFAASLYMMDDDLLCSLSYQDFESEQEFFTAYEVAHLSKFGSEWELSRKSPVW